MPWLEPARTEEPEEDRALRAELKAMLGLPEADLADVEPGPELFFLAERLRGEAARRRRMEQRRPAWVLLTAALPAFLVVGLAGAWGLNQKRRADALASTLQQQERQFRQDLATTTLALQQERQAREELLQRVSDPQKGRLRGRVPELVIPVDRPLARPATDAQTVKAQ